MMFTYDRMSFAAQVQLMAEARRRDEIARGEVPATPLPVLEPYIRAVIRDTVSTAHVIESILKFRKDDTERP